MPGKAATTQVPADDSARNAATLFAGQYEGITDGLTYLNKVAHMRPPVAPDTSAVGKTGFTTVARVGAGSGTVVVVAAGAAAVSSGQEVSVIIKITTGGAAGGGTAQFAWSNDGGVTFNAPVNIPNGNYTEGTSNITVTFAGTFTLNDSYSFQPADTPIARYMDQAGSNVGHIIDHLGFAIDRVSTIREHWRAVGASITGAGTAALAGTSENCWSSVLVVNGAIQGNQAPTAAYPAQMVAMSVGASGDRSYIETTNGILHPGVIQFLQAVFVWEMSLSTVGAATNADIYATLTTLTDMNGAANNAWCGFKKPGNSASWVLNAGAGTQTIVGFDPVATTIQRFKMELHGVAGRYGSSIARFFINDQFVGASAASSLSQNPLRLLFGVNATGATGGTQSINLGPVHGAWGRFQAPVH